MSDTHAQTVAYVRETMLPEQEPPVTERGVVKWMRENLFRGWFNSILTIVSIYIIYKIAVGAFPWFANGVWTTNSLAECREILQGATGGCFSVLTERWNQLLFGFKYPDDQYWRPTLAFLIMLVSIAPVLFSFLPRKMLILTGLFPFVAFWLIWGGSLWTPILVLVSLLIAYAAFQRQLHQSFAMGALAFLAVVIVLLMNPVAWVLNGMGSFAAFFTEGEVTLDWSIFGFSIRDIFPLSDHVVWVLDSVIPISLEPVASRDMGGFMLNMILGTVCVSLSLPIGICLALGRQSDMPIIKWICVIFIEFIRGVPLITLLFVANVVLAYFLPPGTNFDLIVRVIIMITAFSSAYIAEVIRGGLAALPRGQYEAADSLGLDYAQATRLIIMPQALKISIPGIVNVAVGLFKDTTLVSVISMFDLVGMIRGPILASTEWNGVYWELWGFAVFVFFIVCYGISQYSQWLERQLQTDHR